MLETFLILPISIIAFAVLLMIIVFFHEYGHFSVARLLGVKVDVFSIGFGKPILKWVDRKGTEWRISSLPLGGYVKFFGDLNAASQGPAEAAQRPATTQFPGPREADEIAGGMSAEDRKVCFHFKPVWARAAVVAAGPLANFVLAVAIFTVLFMTLGRGMIEPVVGGVAEESPAAMAGFEAGDRIVSANGQRIEKFGDLYDAVLVSGGGEMRFEVDRGGETVSIVASPRRIEDTDRYGNKIERWQLGIAPPSQEYYSFRKYGPVEAVAAGFGELGRILALTVRYIGKIVLGKEDASQLGGPIKMAQYAGQSVMSGFDDSSYREPPGFLFKLRSSLIDFIFLSAVVSVSIGFLNLLPVPVLDGGHLMYYAYEAVAGRPLGARAQAIGFRLGIVLLASLMIFVTWNDINNLLSSIS
ncbi:M50 family metallopeptidase [Hyphococcus sp.]|uniref:M50 family metallopeptidase n=1 Tax=Hyphococcus sp. TaxID=2038636 RepID=UPI0035C70272